MTKRAPTRAADADECYTLADGTRVYAEPGLSRAELRRLQLALAPVFRAARQKLEEDRARAGVEFRRSRRRDRDGWRWRCPGIHGGRWSRWYVSHAAAQSGFGLVLHHLRRARLPGDGRRKP